MAIDFSQLPPEQEFQKGPLSRLFWMIMFFSLILAGVIVVLLSWPKDEPTQTPWFWLCLTLYPAGIATFVVSRRYAVYEGHKLDVEAWNEARQAYIDTVFERASIPFAVLGVAFSFIDDDKLDNSASIAESTLVLKAQPAIAAQGTVLARWFSPTALDRDRWVRGPDMARQREMVDWIVGRLLEKSREALAKIPADLRLFVRVRVSANAYRGDMASILCDHWRRKNLRPCTVITEPDDMRLINIDSWLDSSDFRIRKHATLVLVIELNEILGKNPPEGSAEAGAAVLLVPEHLSRRHELEPVAYVHRPMAASQDNLVQMMEYALRWAKADPPSVGRLWLSNVNASSAAALHASLRTVGVTGRHTDSLPELNMDRTVGHAGSAADWLTVACAADRARQIGTPQLLIVQHGADIVSAVVAAA